MNGCDPTVRGSLPLVYEACKWKLSSVLDSQLASQSGRTGVKWGKVPSRWTTESVVEVVATTVVGGLLVVYPFWEGTDVLASLLGVTLIRREVLVTGRSLRDVKISVRKSGINGPGEPRRISVLPPKKGKLRPNLQ